MVVFLQNSTVAAKVSDMLFGSISGDLLKFGHDAFNLVPWVLGVKEPVELWLRTNKSGLLQPRLLLCLRGPMGNSRLFGGSSGKVRNCRV